MSSRSAPGKTFLVGEYLALEGGPSILLSTKPRFVLSVTKGRAGRTPFAPQSPAGRFLSRHEISGMKIEFKDPHRGKGGLGASSAQFALLYTWFKNIESIDPAKFDWKTLLEEYRACAWSGEGKPPSGADVVAQLTGGVCWFDGRENVARKLDWPFKNLSFTLIRTGAKLATHEHLKSAKAAPHDALRDVVRAVTNSLENQNESGLIEAVDECASVLERAELTARATLGLLNAMRTSGDWALAAKGCGAMGADVILVLHDRARGTEVRDWAEGKDLEICGGLEDLTTGFEISAPKGKA